VPSPDVLIIGGGPAGYVGAIRLAQLGKQVVVVERERLGGICLNQGCIPVKALLHAGSVVRNAAEARRFGVLFQAPDIDIVSLHGWKARIVDRLVRGIEYLFQANGVELVHGQAVFSGPEEVMVRTKAGEMSFTARNFVIATGSRPAMPSGIEPDGHKVISSKEALNLTTLPKRIAIIGAGAIGLEFATVFSRLGCKVIVLELMNQVLPGTDSDLASVVERQLRREGIEFQFGAKVREIVKEPHLYVRYTGGGSEQILETEQVLVAVGREPLTQELNLHKAGVQTDKQGFIKVNGSYRTSVPNIYAIGDVKGGALVAHKAMAEGIALAEIIGETGKEWNFRAVPFCVYTDPEIASVGWTAELARKQGLKIKVSRVPLSAAGRSLTLGRNEGFCKIVVEEKTDRILGVGIVGPQAEALIAEAAVAVELGLTAEQIGKVVHPHPTMSELLFEAARAIHGRAIHIVNK